MIFRIKIDENMDVCISKSCQDSGATFSIKKNEINMENKQKKYILKAQGTSRDRALVLGACREPVLGTRSLLHITFWLMSQHSKLAKTTIFVRTTWRCYHRRGVVGSFCRIIAFRRRFEAPQYKFHYVESSEVIPNNPWRALQINRSTYRNNDHVWGTTVYHKITGVYRLAVWTFNSSDFPTGMDDLCKHIPLMIYRNRIVDLRQTRSL